jgi:hypothetical protein
VSARSRYRPWFLDGEPVKAARHIHERLPEDAEIVVDYKFRPIDEDDPFVAALRRHIGRLGDLGSDS